MTRFLSYIRQNPDLHEVIYKAINENDYKSQEQLEQIYADAMLGKNVIDLGKLRKPAMMNNVKKMFHERQKLLRMVIGDEALDAITPVLDEMDIMTSEEYDNYDD